MHLCPRPPRLAVLAALLLGTALSAAQAAQTVRLPAAACSADRLFGSGFDRGAVDAPGGGGPMPGEVTRVVSAGGPTAQALLYVPPGYRHGRPAALLVALHGAPGSAAQVPAAADALRDAWKPTADAGGFLVLAPLASGASGGWSPSIDGPLLGAAIDDVRAAYSVDPGRILLWGFSAGGHWGYDLALRNPDLFAGFGAQAGALQAYACDTAGAPGCASLLASVSPRLPIMLRVGSQDPLRSYVAADRQRLAQAGWVGGDTLDAAEFPGGHTYAPAELGQAWAFLCRFGLEP